MDRFVPCATPAGTLQVRIADTFVARALGLLVGAPLGPEEALLIAPCSSIHTIGMGYPIDVVFIDRHGRIVRVFPEVRAGRIRLALGACAALELRAGAAARHGLSVGLQLPRFAGKATQSH